MRGFIPFPAPTGSFLPTGQNFEADKGDRAQAEKTWERGANEISSNVLPSFGLCVCNLLFRCRLPPCLLMPSGAGILNIYPIPGPHRSVSSHWCGCSKTHTATGRLLTKTPSRASERGWDQGWQEPINLCASAPPWHDGDFKWHGALKEKRKKIERKREQGSGRRRLAVLHP